MDLRRRVTGIVLSFSVFAIPAAHGQGLTFALISKSLQDANFIAAARGCEQAASEDGNHCVHVGPKGAAHFRNQDLAIRHLLERDVDGMALSVTNGEYLARKSLAQVAERNIPLITFDSDLPDDLHSLRQAYVGPDNAEIGRQLGRIVNLFMDGGTLCLMSASPFDTNLNERLLGVRQALTGDPTPDEPGLLTGENGWTETGRCPWYNADDKSRAVTQVFTAYTYEHSDAIVSVGAWPLLDHNRLRSALAPFRDQLRSREKLFILATGGLRPQDTALMNEGLIQGFVSIDFEAMGRASYEVLKRLHEGRAVKEYWPTPVIPVLPGPASVSLDEPAPE
ncbi:sugar ABC transporter substrate-binding protein [Marinobacter halodurans]|uniref:Sugar ABC transporter substrate-binding protein n=1 Tax=Marinobacter halodurans TaxID=2528979 RepID=A0ABY1ZF87_9GAMM|nr:substrate-binding domain-containing protein [Marinobacter halodurans]TBW49501.1 sugar ABC transporter substrate-binding protein [Marinobacter halodurans]